MQTYINRPHVGGRGIELIARHVKLTHQLRIAHIEGTQDGGSLCAICKTSDNREHVLIGVEIAVHHVIYVNPICVDAACWLPEDAVVRG